jgi:tRNA1Val (adenine37-N6)-methyltransferase
MANTYFQFKQFIIHQEHCTMKVTTDSCLFGAWVADVIQNSTFRKLQAADIGTGTGLLSLLVAQKNPDIMIDAFEIDAPAAEQARLNVNASPWKEHIRVIQADIRTFNLTPKYDLVISNPPFYEKEIRSESEQKNIAHHSERLTLKELMNVIKKMLAPGGQFFLLFPFKRNTEIKQLLKDEHLHIGKIVLVRQSVRHPYFRIMLQGYLQQQPEAETELEEISICSEHQHYSNEFIHLLKDYYLHL